MIHPSLRRRLKALAGVICVLLALQTLVIVAQDPATSPTDTSSVATSEVGGTETPPDQSATDTPTETAAQTVEAPTASETPAVTETQAISVTETTTPEASATSVPSTVLPPEPALGLLVRDLFDDADVTTSWAFVPGWSVVASDSGSGLQGLNTSAPLVLQKGQFGNVAVQARFLSSGGSAELNVRENGTDKYTASVDPSGVVTLSRSGSLLQSWTPATPTAPGTWHVLRLSAIDGVLRVSVDGNEIISYLDAAPLPPGNISLSGAFADSTTNPSANTVLVDDFFLWVPQTEYASYPQPTQVVTTPPPAETVEPTAQVTPTEVVTVETTPTSEATTETTPTVETTATLEASPTAEATVPPVPTETGPVYQFKNYDAPPPPSAEMMDLNQPSVNDNFVNATSLQPSIAVSGNTTSDTIELPTAPATTPNENTLATCAYNVDRTVWYAITVPANGSYVLSTAGSDFDTVLAVYKENPTPIANSFHNLVPVVNTTAFCNDDASIYTYTSKVTLSLVTGTTYYVRVGGFNGNYGAFKFGIQLVGTLGIPRLVSPATNTFWNPSPANPLSLNWNPPLNVPAPYQYQVQVADNVGFTAPVIDLPLPLGTPVDVTAFTTGKWYWRVRSLNYVGDASAWSPTFNFTILRSAPNAPVLTTPAPVNGITNLARPTLSWQPVAGAAKYEVELYENPGSTPLLKVSPWTVKTYSLALTTAVMTNALVPGTGYRWVVRAFDGAGNPSGDSTGTFTYVNGPLVAPVLLTPTNNAFTNNASIHFTWKSVTGATGYEVQIASKPTFTSASGDLLATQPTSPIANPVLDFNVTNEGVYYWRVRALNGAAPGTWSAAWKFTVDTTPLSVAPTLLLPPDGGKTNLVRPMLTWKPVTGAVKYLVHLTHGGTELLTTSAGQPKPGERVTTTPSLALALPTVLAQPLQHGETYTWTVAAVDAAGNSGPSSTATGTFTVDLANAPTDGQALTAPTGTVRPTFTWAAAGVTGAKYKVEVSDKSDFLTTLFSSGELSTLSYLTPLANALVPNTVSTPRYYWRLLVQLPGGSFVTPSISHEFTVSASLPLAPNALLMTPKTGAYSFVPTIDFAWPTVTNATDYEIQISKTPTFTLPLVDGEKTGGLPALDNFVLPSTGTFYWRVRGINAIGAPGAWSATRTVIHVLPSAPVLVAPVNNSSTILKQPTFSWKPVTGAVKYQVYLDTVNPPVDGPFGNTAALSYKPPSVLPTGTYYWKVVALDVFDNPSPASDIRVVKIVSAPGDVPIPNHFTAANPVKVTFGPVAWTQNGGHYEVQFATNTTFTANLQPPVIVQTGTQFAQPSTPLANGTWYWRVRACQNANASSCGSWSTTGIFTVDT